jgi:uncharacterized protein (DUF58 family)
MAARSPIKITKAGWLYILLTIVLGFAAVNTANNLIYIIASALLSFMAVSGFFGKNNLVRIGISVEFPGEIYAGKTFPVKVTLANNRRFLPAFLIRVAIGKHEILFPYVEARRETSRTVNIAFASRGEYHITDVNVCSVFPFNFFIRCKPISRSFETIVFPEPRSCHLMDPFEKQIKNMGEHSAGRTGYEDDLISVRDYQDGDPLKYINWKATAKTDQLKTKQFASHLSRPVTLDFAMLPMNGLEAKLSCLTYMIIRLLKNNIPVGLKLKSKLMKPNTTHNHKISMLKELALYVED